MKKIFTLVLFIVGLYITVSAQGTVPNAGFETWTDSTCTSWGSISIAPIPFVFPNGYYAMKKTTDKHSGTYAAKLVSGNLQGTNVPGVATLGVVNLTTQTITGGTPFTQKPATMKFWYKYAPVSGDTMIVYIVLLKRNGSVTDTVAVGSFESTQAVSVYTQQTITLDYYLPLVTPDTMNITGLSSEAVSHSGSTLYLDDITLEGLFVGLPENNLVSKISLSPNPTSGIINVETGYSTSKIKIINAIGQEVYTSNFSNKKSVNLQHLPKGLYVAEISSGDVKSVKRFVLK